MHNGFYEELENIIKDDEDANFGFMENTSYEIWGKYKNENGKEFRHLITAYDFLHGYCDEFAFSLHEKFGYPVYQINDEDGKMIHCFAMIIFNDIHYFIDVRGVTTDYSEFLSEFEDWTDEESSIENTKELNLGIVSISEENKAFMEKLFSDYGYYYKIS